jgi:hypothetical protein
MKGSWLTSNLHDCTLLLLLHLYTACRCLLAVLLTAPAPSHQGAVRSPAAAAPAPAEVLMTDTEGSVNTLTAACVAASVAAGPKTCQQATGSSPAWVKPVAAANALMLATVAADSAVLPLCVVGLQCWGASRAMTLGISSGAAVQCQHRLQSQLV